MKHTTNSRRGRNRNNGKRHIPLRSQTFESNGPDGKIRGTAQQVVDRYLALGRDAYSAGDPITAESFYQHAEHYYRIINANGGDHGQNGRFRQGQQPDGQDSPIEARHPGEGEQPQPAERRREVTGPGEEPYDPSEDPVEA